MEFIACLNVQKRSSLFFGQPTFIQQSEQYKSFQKVMIGWKNKRLFRKTLAV